MRFSALLIVCVCPCALFAASQPERRVYAHYMACCPAATKAIPYHFRCQRDADIHRLLDPSTYTNRYTIMSWDMRKLVMVSSAIRRTLSFGNPNVPEEISGKAMLSQFRSLAASSAFR